MRLNSSHLVLTLVFNKPAAVDHFLVSVLLLRGRPLAVEVVVSVLGEAFVASCCCLPFGVLHCVMMAVATVVGFLQLLLAWLANTRWSNITVHYAG